MIQWSVRGSKTTKGNTRTITVEIEARPIEYVYSIVESNWRIGLVNLYSSEICLLNARNLTKSLRHKVNEHPYISIVPPGSSVDRWYTSRMVDNCDTLLSLISYTNLPRHVIMVCRKTCSVSNYWIAFLRKPVQIKCFSGSRPDHSGIDWWLLILGFLPATSA
jgi:hypothetical protein